MENDNSTKRTIMPELHIVMGCIEFAILKGSGMSLFAMICFHLLNCMSLKQNAIKTATITIIIWISLYVLTGDSNVQGIAKNIVIACFGFTLSTYLVLR